MPRSSEEKKIIETRALTAARNAGVPIPSAEVSGEEPDFKFNQGMLGIEVSELLKPPSSNSGIMPAEEANYRQEVTRMAQEQYYAAADATPVKINLYFANARGKRRDKREMALTLAEFVKANLPRGSETLNFSGLELPEGFGSMSMWVESGDWICGQGGSYTISNIHEALTSRIAQKNKLLPTYRKNLAPGAQVWLLLYSTVAVPRGMEIPHGIEQWRFNFDFDRAFWFACLEQRSVEIRRAEASSAAKL